MIGWLDLTSNDQFDRAAGDIADGDKFWRFNNFLVPRFFLAQLLTGLVDDISGAANVGAWIELQGKARHTIPHRFVDDMLDGAIW